MPLNTQEFLEQLDAKLRERPDMVKLFRILSPLTANLRDADAAGDKNAVAAIYLDIQKRLDFALASPPKAPPPIIPSQTQSPDAPRIFDPFTTKEMLLENAKRWIEFQVNKRGDTSAYFGFGRSKNINGTWGMTPSSDDIMRAMTPEKIELVRDFEQPILIMTPFGISLGNLLTALMSQKGTMKNRNPSVNYWNVEEELSGNFDHDLLDSIVYEAIRFDPENHGGKTKRAIIDDRERKYRNWRVLVVDGLDGKDDSPTWNNANELLDSDQRLGYEGLTPEDNIMLEAEGVRRGKPFARGDSIWLTGAYLPGLNGVPIAAWQNSRSEYSCEGPTHMDATISSRPAVRLI